MPPATTDYLTLGAMIATPILVAALGGLGVFTWLRRKLPVDNRAEIRRLATGAFAIVERIAGRLSSRDDGTWQDKTGDITKALIPVARAIVQEVLADVDGDLRKLDKAKLGLGIVEAHQKKRLSDVERSIALAQFTVERQRRKASGYPMGSVQLGRPLLARNGPALTAASISEDAE